MLPPIACPDADILTSLLSGRLPYREVERFAKHLEECIDCARAAEKLGIEDPLASALPASVSVGLDADEERVSSLIQDLCQLQSTARIAENGGETAHNTLWDIGSALAHSSQPDFLGRIGPYWVQSQIGSGGMGEVYLARQERPNRAVALKILRPRLGSDRNLLARFHAEADAAARLRHPNIVQVYQSGESAEAAFIAMELVEGGSLSARLTESVLAPREAARLMSPLARAVNFAHTNGVVHRDLKPSNVLLERDGTPKLSDFGLAKLIGEAGGDRTRTGEVIGTPSYMAPEQADGERTAGPQSDIYGLGAILYECLTGRPPFKGSSPLNTLEQIRTLDPIPPAKLQPGIPRDLQTICLKCLEKNSSSRYPSALELAEDLERFLRGEPIVARPVGVAIRTWKWARRRPTIAGLLAIVCVLASGIAALIVTYTARLHTEVERANANAVEARRQQDRASAHYRSARSAIRLIIKRLDDHRTDEIPRLSELRQNQLEDALSFYEGILGGLNDPSPEVQLDAAVAAAVVGEIQFRLGRHGPSEESFLRAIALYEGLPDEIRTSRDGRNGLIHCYNHLGELGKSREGRMEHYLLKARAEAEEQARIEPPDSNWWNVVANVENNLAGYYYNAGREDRAEQGYLKAIEIRSRLTSYHPEIETYRADLGETFLNLGHAYNSANRVSKSEEAFRQADDLLRPLFQAHPGEDRYRLSLAALCIDWGHLAMRADRPQALAKFNRAVDLADPVLAREPHDIHARERSIQAHGSRAEVLYQLGRVTEALNDWDCLVERADDSARPGHQVNRAYVLYLAGRRQQAIAAAFDLIGNARLSDSNRYNLACIFALSASPERVELAFCPLTSVAAAELRAAIALDLLRSLKKAGFFLQPGHERLLLEDVDLGQIRKSKAFHSLLNDRTANPG
jgi:tetratricopeptide (TPR) repeat protein